MGHLMIEGKRHCRSCHGRTQEEVALAVLGVPNGHRPHKGDPDCCCDDEHLRRYAGYDVTLRRKVVA